MKNDPDFSIIFQERKPIFLQKINSYLILKIDKEGNFSNWLGQNAAELYFTGPPTMIQFAGVVDGLACQNWVNLKLTLARIIGAIYRDSGFNYLCM